MLDFLEQLKERAERAVWQVELGALTRRRRALVWSARLVQSLIRELAQGQLNLRAMSLVYTTLLAMVPLLAVSFSVLKAFGVHNELEAALSSVLAPLGEKGEELSGTIVSFVDNVKVGVLGSIGLGLLFYTVISMVQKVERAFNYTWRVEQSRSVMERVSDYLSVVVVGPVFVFAALGLTATITGAAMFRELAAIAPFGFLLRLLTQAVPYALVIAGFMFVYMFVPNTKVRAKSALVGGVVSGVLWESTGWAFASFVASTTSYTAIYSSFAILILFMIWLYVSWMILLVGASVAFYHQHPEYLGLEERELPLGGALKEKLALQLVYLVARNFRRDLPGWTLTRLAKHTEVPIDPLGKIVSALERGGILVQTRSDPPVFMLSRDYELIGLKEVLDVIRTDEQRSRSYADRVRCEPAVERVVEEADTALRAALAGRTVKELGAEDAVPLTPVPAAPERPGEADPAGHRETAGRGRQQSAR